MDNRYYFLFYGIMLIFYNLKYFQQNGYFIQRDFINYFRKNWKYLFFSIAIIIVYQFFKLEWISIAFSGLVALYLIFKLSRHKILKVKFTKRMNRLLFTIFILFGIGFYFFHFYCLLIINLILYLANIINAPIEKMIYKKYIKKLKETLKNFKGIKIAITGSYGKTSTKHFLATLLQKKYNVFYTQESYNTPMGIAKSLIGKLNNFYDVCILEFGACKKNDIRELMRLTELDITILTGISNQHLNTFKTQENIIREKFLIVEMLSKKGISIINNQSYYVKNYFIKNSCKVIYYENNPRDTLYYDQISLVEDSIHFMLHKEEKSFPIQMKVLGKYNADNYMLCVHCSLLLNMQMEEIVEATRWIMPVSNRVQFSKVGLITLINNSFNSNLKGALENIQLLENYSSKKIIITPGLVDLGKEQRASNLKIIEKINQICDLCIVVNAKNRDLFVKNLSIPFQCFDYFKEGYNFLISNFQDEVICLIENDLPDKY